MKFSCDKLEEGLAVGEEDDAAPARLAVGGVDDLLDFTGAKRGGDDTVVSDAGRGEEPAVVGALLSVGAPLDLNSGGGAKGDGPEAARFFLDRGAEEGDGSEEDEEEIKHDDGDDDDSMGLERYRERKSDDDVHTPQAPRSAKNFY